MATSDGAGLLAGVLADPKDDTVRLAYADWLDEHSSAVRRCSGTHRHPTRVGLDQRVWHDTDPTFPHHRCDEKCLVPDDRADRAAFTRAQVELARLELSDDAPAAEGRCWCERCLRGAGRRCRFCGEKGHPRKARAGSQMARWAELTAMVRDLCPPAWPRDWFDTPGWRTVWHGIPAGLPEGGHVTWVPGRLDATGPGVDLMGIEAIVRRGFIDQVRCYPDSWVRHYRTMRAHHPVRKVSLTAWPALEAHYDQPRARFTVRVAGFDPHAVLSEAEFVAAGQEPLPLLERLGRTALELTWPGIEFDVPRLGQWDPMAAVPQAGWGTAPHSAPLPQSRPVSRTAR